MKALKLNPTLTQAKAPQRNPHNVERSGFHRGEHVAYGTNREGAHDVWRVRKMGNRYEATARATGERLSGRTLKEVGAAIEAQSPRFDDGKVPQRNPSKRVYSFMALAPDRSPLAGYEVQASGIQSVKRSRKKIGDDLRMLHGEDVILTRPVRKPFDTKKLQRNPSNYAGGVGFWRKSIGLAEGKPKHLVPRPMHTTDIDYVEYVRPLADEPVFELGGNRYQYVVGRYPSGREDIAVYSFAGDVTHGYAFFRRMLNLP